MLVTCCYLLPAVHTAKPTANFSFSSLQQCWWSLLSSVPLHSCASHSHLSEAIHSLVLLRKILLISFPFPFSLSVFCSVPCACDATDGYKYERLGQTFPSSQSVSQLETAASSQLPLFIPANISSDHHHCQHFRSVLFCHRFIR